MAKTYQLYRHYDKAGTLLYVGLCLSVFRRTIQHRTKASWFGDIATITVEHIANSTEAMAAEVEAIKTEKPKYNRTTRSCDPARSSDFMGKYYARKRQARIRCAELNGEAA